jgi:uncharacterized membrane protein
MTQLIAVVATAVIVNGERIVIPPGKPLPELSEHDAEALKRSGAALDPQLDAETMQVAEEAALAAAADFQSARARVQAEAASIAPQPTQAEQEPSQSTGAAASTQTSAKTSAKTAKKS